jgi:hypothetical protein
MPHHDEYDSTPSQSKAITPDELKAYVSSLYETLATPGMLTEAKGHIRSRTGAKADRGVSLELYDRRLPMHKTTIQFLRTVLSDLRPDLREILKFAADTEECLFLFDETIADYLAQLFKRALRIRAVSLMLDKNGWTASLGDEDMRLSAWFSEQIEETRRKFTPFLRLDRRAAHTS